MNWAKLFVMSILLIGLFNGLIMRAVFADRHCALVLEIYYAARQQAIQNNRTGESLMCELDFKQTTKHFEEAIADASNCGCNPLKQKLEATLVELTALYDNATSTASTCQALQSAG